MKIGIVTFHNGSNYGAALQAYALQEKVRELYENVYIINYKNRFIMKGLDKIRWGMSLHNIYYTFVDMFNYRNNAKKISRFLDFFNRYYTLTELLDGQELKTKNWNWDLCISGSDQIWNPLLNQGLDDIYFGCFSGVKRKISYASSTGAYQFDNLKWNEEFKNYLASYEKISVRENAGRIKEKTGLDVTEVLDPTLLLSREDWKERFHLQSTNDRYVLVYAMNNIDAIIAYACEIARQLKMNVWVIGNYFRHRKNVRCISDAGPIEFVDLFFNASYVVTNSFHGTAFSLNFKKQFSSVYNQKSPERAKQLLERCGLKNRLIRDLSDNTVYHITDQEFEESQKWLMERRLDAEEFLKISER